jgi:hypothetical protein
MVPAVGQSPFRHNHFGFLRCTGRRGATLKQYTYANGVSRMREGSMRALWMVSALIGVGILIFAHATVVGIVVGIAFLGLAAFLYRRPLVHRLGLSHR